jgi:heme-degrading monooxygenase HmoA
VFARATFGEAPPERLDEMTHEVIEHVLPALRIQDGFKGGMILVERGSGKVLGVTLWESEQAMDATEEASQWLRIFSAESSGGTICSVERYEVFYAAIQEAPPSERSGESRSAEARRPSGASGVR